MAPWFLAAATLAVGAWIGAIVFQSAVVAPRVFGELDEPAARRFLRALFPRFFKLGLICGGVGMASLALTGLVTAWTPALIKLLGVIAAMTLLGAASLRMVPMINAARDAGAAGQARFRRLHRINVILTLVILAAGAAVLGTLGAIAGRSLV